MRKEVIFKNIDKDEWYTLVEGMVEGKKYNVLYEGDCAYVVEGVGIKGYLAVPKEYFVKI